MDIDFLLNDVLNKALITNRIKGIPNSNKIAQFVIDYLETKPLNIDGVSNCDADFNEEPKLTIEDIEEDCRNIPN